MTNGKLFRSRSSVIVASLLHMILVSCMSGNVKSAPGTTTTVILIRHAERTEKGPVNGSYLTPEGRKRSQALAAAVKDMGITAIYSPKLGRNLETVKPLSEQTGVPVIINDTINMFTVDEIADEILSKQAGGVVLYVGNVSGNLMAMYRHLGGSGLGPTEYGEMSIFVISDQGTISVTESHFGD
jgi:Histidine phosphatase superfamily (branch 1)